MQIDDLLRKIDEKDGDLARTVEEKEQELLIMQEGMDSTLQELSNLRIVSGSPLYRLVLMSEPRRHLAGIRCTGRHAHPRPPQRAQRHH